MSISGLFEKLGAPLVNVRWSWGAERARDGAIILRVWNDLKFVRPDGQTCMLVLGHTDVGGKPGPGVVERERHINRIRRGARCFLVMCVVKDPDAQIRQIESFDDTHVFVGGPIFDTPADFALPATISGAAKKYAKDGGTWIPLAGRKSVWEVAREE